MAVYASAKRVAARHAGLSPVAEAQQVMGAYLDQVEQRRGKATMRAAFAEDDNDPFVKKLGPNPLASLAVALVQMLDATVLDKELEVAGKPGRNFRQDWPKLRAVPISIEAASYVYEEGTQNLKRMAEAVVQDKARSYGLQVRLAERNVAALAQGWMTVKRFFPGVRSPLFHATRGTRVHGIFREGLRPDAKDGAPAQQGMSLTRDLTWALKGNFGRFVLVLDRNELRQRFDVSPSQYTSWEDEFEERVTTDRIPPSMIRGIVTSHRPMRSEIEEWKTKLSVPVVYLSGGKWVSTHS
jgi:hypothetical protein